MHIDTRTGDIYDFLNELKYVLQYPRKKRVEQTIVRMK